MADSGLHPQPYTLNPEISRSQALLKPSSWEGRGEAACAGVFRVLGPDVAELPVLAVRPELQGNGLGRLLLALLENALLEARVKLLAMPALVPFPSSSPQQAALQNGQLGTAGTADRHEQVSQLYVAHVRSLPA